MTDTILINDLIKKPTLLSTLILNSLDPFEEYNIIPGETEELVIDLKINGKDASIQTWLDHMKKEMSRLIEVEAANLLRSKLSKDDNEQMKNIRRMIRKFEVELFDKYFPNDPEFNETRWDDT